MTTEDIALFERLVAIARDHKLRSFTFQGISAEFQPAAYSQPQARETFAPSTGSTGIPPMFPEDEQ